MWPLKLDMTRDESRGMLRRLELDTYSSVMSTFRAQGALCKEKARILEELRRLLHISQDRHKAEARRVANDERLTTVAEIISGPNSTQDWSREGRRTFPILPRTTPYTALSYIANTVCEQITRENSKLPHPFETSQNRLQKEQQQEEERKQKLLLEKETKDQASAPIAIKEEENDLMVTTPLTSVPAVEPSPNKVHLPVVTVDPFVEAANKSYINNDLKRSYPIDPSPSLSSPVQIDDDSPLRKKPQLYQELQKQEPVISPQSPIVTFHSQFSPQQISAEDPMSPHKNLTSPNNVGMTAGTMPSNMNNTNININNNFNPKAVQGRNSNKNTERPRKSSVSKKNQNKTKTPYQTNKQVGGKANKNSIAQQQLQQTQMMPSGPSSAPGKGQKGNNSANSPHLIHSYASPLLPYEIPQQQSQLVGATAEISSEPLQLQKHLTSNTVYQPNQQTQQYGMTPIKSAPYTGSYQQSNTNMPAPNPIYGQQHQILPSSKKDIQYNLTKLNPTNSSSASIKNNINIPLKQSSGSSSSSASIMQGKGHPLFNYQKKSPSKNVLIPTSSAAAALASLGIPKTIQPRKDVPKFREPDPSVNPADIPNPKIIFSTSHHQEPAAPAIAPKSSGSQITILDQITLHPPHTIVPSTSAGTGLTITPSQSIVPVTHITPAAVPSSPGTSPLAAGKVITPPVGTIPANKLVTIKGPNLAGFTPVKSGSKLSVHKLQLMPISSQPGRTKNNVIVLPAKGGTLNPGQKITIPRSSVTSVIDPATIISPPKVIVQQQPDLNNIVLLDLASEPNKLKTITQPKSVITEDTASTPLDVVTGAAKLQELKGFLSPASSSGTSTTASPLTEKMVKPQQPNSNVSKATKFEADSTAPGPSVAPIPKKPKANHQPRASTSVAALSKKTKATTAAASSTTPTGSDPTSASTARNPAMSSSTDWELELDQANQATNFKQTPNPPPKVAQKSAPRSAIATLPVTTPIPKSTPATLSNVAGKKASQPLSSSSISSTSSNASSPVVVEQIVSSDVVVVPQRIAAQQQQRITAAPSQPPVTPVGQKVVLPSALTTSPPNERSSDDTSATDSANAEEDPDPEYPAFREATSESDDDYEHFNAVIEEDPDPEDAEDIHGERVEIVNVGYDTSRALIADLEDTSGGTPTTAAAMVVEEDDRNGAGGGGGGTINPSSMNFVQYIEEADVGVGELIVDANGGAGESTSGSNGTRNITFEMVEIDSEGNKHTRTLSYEEALAEGHITTEEDVKGGTSSSSNSTSGAGLVKGKTKSTS